MPSNLRIGVDQPEHDADEQHRPQRRQGDVPEDLPAVGAVGGGRFLQLVRYGEQPGQQQDGLEGDAGPHVGDDHGRHRQVRVAEPQRLGQVEEPQEVVDPAGVVVEHRPPGQGDHDRRGHDRQHEERPDQPGAASFEVHQQGQGQAEDRVQDGRADHQIGGVEDDPRGLRVVDQPVEVGPPGEVPVRQDQVVVRDAEADRDRERDGRHRQHDQQRGPRDQRQEVLVGPRPDGRAPACGRGASLGLIDGCNISHQ